ncbi:4-hydroxybenzoate polyprenyltransferase [Lipingzhangella halophila]|uniref:4-hydroxybenzoate polyprenyltransferase n=1 Tax=Lipingzhangella halophila TaxID=1783352 RepID=A0A7W7RLC6_9ACTN|nr:hypothetical protein [Lipingzhangella halophila]MBB4934100.1 4-hydroxybenzoate polyprenyltransferase [Lipingzhangella halophila]
MLKGPPSGPPARVGSAVAALIAAVLTLLVPVVFWLLSFYLLALLVNIPAIAFAAVALSKTDDPPEVERFMRYSWAATIIYIGLVLVLILVLVLVAISLT